MNEKQIIIPYSEYLELIKPKEETNTISAEEVLIDLIQTSNRPGGMSIFDAMKYSNEFTFISTGPLKVTIKRK